MDATATSIIRTITPTIAGFIITFLASKGITLDDQFSANLLLLIQGVVTAVYYIFVRILEVKVSPKFGWLLGSTKTPEYIEPGQ